MTMNFIIITTIIITITITTTIAIEKGRAYDQTIKFYLFFQVCIQVTYIFIIIIIIINGIFQYKKQFRLLWNI